MLINIHEVLERVRNLIELESTPPIKIYRDYDPSIPDMYADPELLIQAVLNVARNGVQALGHNGNLLIRTRVHQQLTLGQKRHRLVIRLDIIDDGPGIPAEIDKNVFYPMISGRAEGTGLGLSIAQSLVNLHGGVINYERKDDKTIFSIYLPVSED
jgi:two-component system nitrogen regulation sensor histidine kinase GlnL